MDWIERVFGISPDGGDGTTEAMFFIAALAVAAAIIFAYLAFGNTLVACSAERSDARH